MDTQELEHILSAGVKQIQDAKSIAELNELKGSLLGKKSSLTQAFSQLKDIQSQEEKQAFGKKINDVKVALTEAMEVQLKKINDELIKERVTKEKIDITLPGKGNELGSRHPLQAIIDDFTEYFVGQGYSVAEGPEVELDHFNFELLNIPKDHPARDMQDSFYIDTNSLMRSHTSCVQARVMQDKKGVGPIKIICPGKVYRRDEDVTHSHQFGQIECLVIGENVTMGQLQETLIKMLRHFFGEKRQVRFRPSFFPFTEPSVEVDISCFNCQGKGCSMCKHTGWIEVLGAGMVHPNVLRLNGFDDKKYTGFAFGIGIDRFAMLKYGIDDIRRFYQNDVEFIKQFSKE